MSRTCWKRFSDLQIIETDESMLVRESAVKRRDDTLQARHTRTSSFSPWGHVDQSLQLFRIRPLELFWWFITERQAIWRRRVVERQPPPWTSDLILRNYRFTNVYRELDPGTRFAIENILETPYSAKDRIFNIMLYRLIGKSDTFAAIGFQLVEKFDQNAFASKLKNIRDIERRAPFTGAYMVAPYTK